MIIMIMIIMITLGGGATPPGPPDGGTQPLLPRSPFQLAVCHQDHHDNDDDGHDDDNNDDDDDRGVCTWVGGAVWDFSRRAGADASRPSQECSLKYSNFDKSANCNTFKLEYIQQRFIVERGSGCFHLCLILTRYFVHVCDIFTHTHVLYHSKINLPKCWCRYERKYDDADAEIESTLGGRQRLELGHLGEESTAQCSTLLHCSNVAA